MRSRQADAPAGRRPAVLRNLGSGVLDAAVPSLVSLTVSVIAARSMDLTDFGVFSTVVLALTVAVGLSRSVHGDVLVLGARHDPATADRRIRQSLASVLLLGLVVGVLLVLAGAALAWSGASRVTWGVALAAAGASLPVLLLQDHYRWIAYAHGRLRDSVQSNVLWGVAALVAMTTVVVSLPGPMPAAAGVLVWGLSSSVGALWGAVRSRHRPRTERGLGWLSDNRRIAGALAQDFALLQASAQGALVLLAVLTSATDIGLLRKAQIWLGPLTMVTTGLLGALQSVLARRGVPAAVGRTAMAVGAVAALGATLYGAAVLVLPDSWAEFLAGGDWQRARDFVWPLMVQLAAGLLGGCAGVALRVRGRVTQQVRLRWIIAPTSLVVVVVTASLGGALAATWGLAAVSLVTAAAWCQLLRLSARSDADSRAETVMRTGS